MQDNHAIYDTMLKDAPPMDVPDLARRGYRLLGTYSDIVIAGRKMDGDNYEFVTWLRGTTGTGVIGGLYRHNDLDQAKYDFIRRSGLAPQPGRRYDRA